MDKKLGIPSKAEVIVDRGINWMHYEVKVGSYSSNDAVLTVILGEKKMEIGKL